MRRDVIRRNKQTNIEIVCIIKCITEIVNEFSYYKYKDVDVDVEEIRAQTNNIIVSMPVLNIQFLITNL